MDMWTCWHFQIFVAPKFWADFLGKMEAPSSTSIFLLVMLLPGRCLYKLDAGQLRNGRKFPSAMLVETWKSCLCWRNLCQINLKVRLKLLKSKLEHYIYIYIYPIASPHCWLYISTCTHTNTLYTYSYTYVLHTHTHTYNFSIIYIYIHTHAHMYIYIPHDSSHIRCLIPRICDDKTTNSIYCLDSALPPARPLK